MATAPVILDQYGRPIQRQALTQEQGGATVRGVRQPFTGHQANNLTPAKLGRILRESIDGDPQSYLELAEDMEERDNHYAAVLMTRKRQVSGLDVTVEAASDDPDAVKMADLVREVVDREEFADELIDILDALGKSYSCTEIIWDTSEGQWRPARLEWNDPRFFVFDPMNLRTILLRGDAGYEPLKPYGWITHRAKVKSGLTIRGGLARAVAWTFLFKSFTMKDWAIFVEAYGQPLRLGKYGPDATDAQKDVLLDAVSAVGVDFAAIIPASMTIDFVKAEISGSHDLYESRLEFLDKQISKLVLGQTSTTDAQSGTYAVGKVHDGVREDIEISDARQLAATLNRDLVRPLIDLNFGPQKVYPKIKIGRPDEEDVAALVENVVKLVPLGLKVGMSTMRDKIGLPEPDKNEELLQAQQPPQQPGNPPQLPQPADNSPPTDQTAAQVAAMAAAMEARLDAVDRAVSSALDDNGYEPLIAPMVEGLGDKLAEATSIDDARKILADHFETMDSSALGELLARLTFSSRLAGAAGEDL
jgi:phage gp29-like protein